MEEHAVKILSITPVTHDVNHYKVERPENYDFIPGQATEVAIKKPGWMKERRPFTFTGLTEWSHLEFTIKSYKDRQGVTNELLTLKPGDELLLHDVWGAIHYKGPGIFIAGGAGVTPFIAIFRDLHKRGETKQNKLIFSNKTESDIILKDEFTEMLGENFVNILSRENKPGYHHGHFSKEFLQKFITDKNPYFYICGPDPMIDLVKGILNELGVGGNSIVVEL